jgi:uncharacterized protein (DUF1697 family)
MKTFIALLRGINVSGQKKIRMADLKAHLEELGWEGILTYIQSGNIIFQCHEDHPEKAAEKITLKLKEKYGFDVPALVLEPPDLLYLIQNHPYVKDPDARIERLAVTFLFDNPRAELIHKLEEMRQPNENFHLDGKFIFLHYPDGFGRAVISNNVFEKTLQVEATTRNWRTVNKLSEMAKS